MNQTPCSITSCARAMPSSTFPGAAISPKMAPTAAKIVITSRKCAFQFRSEPSKWKANSSPSTTKAIPKHPCVSPDDPGQYVSLSVDLSAHLQVIQHQPLHDFGMAQTYYHVDRLIPSYNALWRSCIILGGTTAKAMVLVSASLPSFSIRHAPVLRQRRVRKGCPTAELALPMARMGLASLRTSTCVTLVQNLPLNARACTCSVPGGSVPCGA